MKRVLLLKIFVCLVVAAFAISGTLSAFNPVDEFDEDDLDFGGATVTYVLWYNPFGAFEEGGDYAGRLDEAKERFNIGSIELLELPWGDELRETMTSRLMGGEADYDVWMLPHVQFWPMAAQGALYPLNLILPEEYYAGLTRSAQEIADVFSIKDEKYSFGLGGLPTGYFVWNVDLFERENLTPLDELWENDEWTWDKMEELAIQATRDTSGDGVIDQYGLDETNPIFFLLANDGRITREIDQERVFTLGEEQAVYALEKIYEWNEVLEIADGQWGAPEFIAGNRAMAGLEQWQIEQLPEQMEDTFSVVPYPRGPHAERHRFPSSAVEGYFLPASSANPEGLVALHHFLWPVEEAIEDSEEYYTDISPDRVSYEAFMDGEENWSGEVYAAEGILGSFWEGDTPVGSAISSIIWGGESAVSSIEAVNEPAQSLLDDIFK